MEIPNSQGANPLVLAALALDARALWAGLITSEFITLILENRGFLLQDSKVRGL
jgi:hypothetical protein